MSLSKGLSEKPVVAELDVGDWGYVREAQAMAS
jgi:hypothetical protein